MPSVGIALPVLNGEAYLGDAIASILAQTHRNIDLVIVDDGSTDRTAAIIKRFAAADPRIRLLRNAGNLGIARTLNRGLAALDNPFITWTSDDNMLDPIAIERLLAEFARDPRLDLVYAGVRLIDAGGRHKKDVRPRSPEYLCIRDEVLACFLYRRRIPEAIGGYNQFWDLASDYDYWLRVRAHGFRMKNLDEVLYSLRMHDRSMTSRNRRRITFLAVALRKRDLRRGPDIPPSLRESAMIRLAADVLKLGSGPRQMRFAAAVARRVSVAAKLQIGYRMMRARIAAVFRRLRATETLGRS